MTARPELRFGTAGVRAPLGPGVAELNDDTVALVGTTLGRYLAELAEDEGIDDPLVVLGGDARHGSSEFVALLATILRDHRLRVVTQSEPVPTPVVAAATRARDALAGVMVTASHNPATDNGIKVFARGGRQIVAPVDAAVEAELDRAAAEGITAATYRPRSGSRTDSADTADLAGEYVEAVTALLPRLARPVRVAVTAVHGVGGDVARRVLEAIGAEVIPVESQWDPDPDFPTAPRPNPELPEVTEPLLALAEEVRADAAVALDPDADRCAMATPFPAGGFAMRWQMLDGDAAGALLADFLLRSGQLDEAPVVASTTVSSRLPGRLVPARGGRHIETPTGFKWLSRAGEPLLYAYEEAIGHSVLPSLVADKDGITAAAMWCALVADLAEAGSSPVRRLADLHEEFGLHTRDNFTVDLPAGADAATVLDSAVADWDPADGSVTPLPAVAGAGYVITVDADAGAGARAVLRPSGTEPLLKAYCEAWTASSPPDSEWNAAFDRLDALAAAVRAALR